MTKLWTTGIDRRAKLTEHRETDSPKLMTKYRPSTTRDKDDC